MEGKSVVNALVPGPMGMDDANVFVLEKVEGKLGMRLERSEFQWIFENDITLGRKCVKFILYRSLLTGEASEEVEIDFSVGNGTAGKRRGRGCRGGKKKQRKKQKRLEDERNWLKRRVEQIQSKLRWMKFARREEAGESNKIKTTKKRR